jgi:hypothetical protein
MQEPDLPSGRWPNVENLERRQDLLRLLIDSHLRWMHETQDQSMKRIHRALVSSLENVVEQYKILQEELQKPHRGNR